MNINLVNNLIDTCRQIRENVKEEPKASKALIEVFQSCIANVKAGVSNINDLKQIEKVIENAYNNHSKKYEKIDKNLTKIKDTALNLIHEK